MKKTITVILALVVLGIIAIGVTLFLATDRRPHNQELPAQKLESVQDDEAWGKSNLPDKAKNIEDNNNPKE